MSMYEDGEGILDEMAEEHFRKAWCPICETHAEDCVGHEEDCLHAEALAKECVHNSGGDVSVNRVASPDALRGVPALPESPLDFPASVEPIRNGRIGHWEGEAKGGEPFPEDIGGNVIPDRIKANEDWFGAESNAYTAEEAEARRKEWNED